MHVTVFPDRCQNPDPKSSHWRELSYPHASDMRDCMIKCSNNKNAEGFQFNTDDRYCGCLSSAPGKTMTDIISGPNVFSGNCAIGIFKSES